MAETKSNGQGLSELQQLRSIVLGEYTLEMDQRLTDLERTMRVAETQLGKAIEDANTLGATEIQAVRDLIEEKMADLTADITKQLSDIKEQLSALNEQKVSANSLGQALISLGEQISGSSKE
ncbi:MAG: hypothetical protein AAGD96_06720 [Chloroflexota bacterium]